MAESTTTQISASWDKIVEKMEASLSRSVDGLVEALRKTPGGGILAGDDHTGTRISVWNTCQVVWTLRYFDRVPKMHPDIRRSVSHVIDQSQKDQEGNPRGDWVRSYVSAFAMLALCADRISMDSPVLERAVMTAMSHQDQSNPERGGWGFAAGDGSRVRPTAYMIYALDEVLRYTDPHYPLREQIGDSVRRGVKWLLHARSPDGMWGRKTVFSSDVYQPGAAFEKGIEATAWALLASLRVANHSDGPYSGLRQDLVEELVPALTWLAGLSADYIATVSEVEEEVIAAPIQYYHRYDSLGLEIAIPAYVEAARNAQLRRRGFVFDAQTLKEWVTRLLANERDGYWYEKCSGDYRQIWAAAHALFALQAVQQYHSEQLSLREATKAYLRQIGGRIKRRFRVRRVLAGIVSLVAGVMILLALPIVESFAAQHASLISSAAFVLSAVGLILALLPVKGTGLPKA